AARAALTGHLVLSTLHAGSCKGVFERLLVLCRDHSAVASSLALVLNQRLLRRLCSQCKGHGCGECFDTGYRGRIPGVEILRVSDTARPKIARGELDGLAAKPTMAEQAAILMREGKTDQK